MATQIPDDMLRSGDLVDVFYEIKPGANPTLVSMAISQVKNDLWADKRFDYQGSRITEEFDPETREPFELLTVTIMVRKYPRGERPERYEAGIFVPIVALVAMLTAAVVAFSVAIIYRSYVVHRIASSEQSDAVKVAGLEAVAQPIFELSKLSVGTVAIGALFLWALFGRKGGRALD